MWVGKLWENSVLTMGKFRDFIAAIASPVCNVFGLLARAVSVLFGFVVVLFRPVHAATFERRRGKIP